MENCENVSGVYTDIKARWKSKERIDLGIRNRFVKAYNEFLSDISQAQQMRDPFCTLIAMLKPMREMFELDENQWNRTTFEQLGGRVSDLE